MRQVHWIVIALLLVQLTNGETLVICNDNCRYHRDGECDDSGPHSESSTCALGTDCTDCGPRKETDMGSFICSNKCHTSHDDQCDDGGPGSQFKTCDFGTDCADCGHRATGAHCGANNKVALCASSCMFASDGHCDDGGPGSKFDSCSLGTDCDDCGKREQHCVDVDDDSYDDFAAAQALSSPPPPSACVGGGRHTCDMTVCSVKMQIDMCRHCQCTKCAFCAAPKDLVRRPPPKPPPHPPPHPAQITFKCDYLKARENTRFPQPPQWCNALPPELCDKSFTYDLGSSGKLELNICMWSKKSCSPTFIPDELYVNQCDQKLLPIPTISPQHSRSSPPPPPPSPHPLTPSPHPPPACIPLSGKCGGDGPEKDWKCCKVSGGKTAQCFKKDGEYSQCRTECVRGWACDDSKKSSELPQLSPSVNLPPSSEENNEQVAQLSPSVDLPPSSEENNEQESEGEVTNEELSQSEISDSEPEGAPADGTSGYEGSTQPSEWFTRSRATPDPCKSCRVVDPSGVGAWRAVSSPKFGNGCYTLNSASSIFESNNGSWPSMPEYSMEEHPSDMRAFPSRCYQLPDGYECFKSPGRGCSSVEHESTSSGDTVASEPPDVLSVSTPYLSFTTQLPPSAIGLAIVILVVFCTCVACCGVTRSPQRGYRVGHEQIPGDEPEPGDIEGSEVDDAHLSRVMMSQKVVSL